MSLFKKAFGGNSDQQNVPNRFETSLKHIDKAHHKVKYRGLPFLKCPFDVVIYQMILSELKPDLIIEIGTNKGGSALYFADLLRLNDNKGIVHTIDLDQSKLDPVVTACENIKLFSGGWQAYAPEEAAGFKNILIIDDGSHTYEDVIQSFYKFEALVPVGSYYIIEDGIIDQLNINERIHHGGPIRALNEIFEKGTDFKVDRQWTDFFGPNATFNIEGYLKRMR